MENNLKKGLLGVLLCLCMVLSAVPVTARADMGPKPSVQVEFTGVPEGKAYYATLLSEKSSTGPARVWDGTVTDARYHQGEEEYEGWKAFVKYEDPDGFYFLQEVWNCTQKNSMRWGYRPPEVFKIAVFFPESNSYFVTEVLEQYAFDSYFTVDLSQATTAAGSAENLVKAEKSYDYTWELVSLVARVVLTILVELGLAWLFGIRERNDFRFIMTVNVVTQIILNVGLNISNYNSGPWAFVGSYILYEFIVFFVEAVVYKRKLGNKYGVRKLSAYTFVANVLSFAAGYGIAYVIPGIF